MISRNLSMFNSKNIKFFQLQLEQKDLEDQKQRNCVLFNKGFTHSFHEDVSSETLERNKVYLSREKEEMQLKKDIDCIHLAATHSLFSQIKYVSLFFLLQEPYDENKRKYIANEIYIRHYVVSV